MKFTVISDSHGLHHLIDLPKGDILLHCGDITDFGTIDEVRSFLDWFSTRNYDRKIFIGGNHDYYLDEQPVDLLELIPSSVTYLNNNATYVDGIKIWGSPVAPDFHEWAFGKKRGLEMKQHWSHMPRDIDILMTHSPPSGILDKSSNWRSIGCEALYLKVNEIKPKYHLFGHAHNSYGKWETETTIFLNAVCLNPLDGPTNRPITFEM